MGVSGTLVKAFPTTASVALMRPAAEGLELTDRGLLKVDENYMTTRPGVFGAGDVITGAKTVVHAVDGAKKAAAAMVQYMEG